MPTPAQTKAIERYCSEVWGQGQAATIDDIFTPDHVRHGPDIEQGGFQGNDGHKELMGLYRTAFPDLTVPAEAIIGDGDVVMTRWTATGTNTGPMLGAAPTGKTMNICGFWMHRFEGDKIAEEWAIWDTQGMLQQIGVTLP